MFLHCCWEVVLLQGHNSMQSHPAYPEGTVITDNQLNYSTKNLLCEQRKIYSDGWMEPSGF